MDKHLKIWDMKGILDRKGHAPKFYQTDPLWCYSLSMTEVNGIAKTKVKGVIKFL